jgi:cytochrome P450
MCSLLLIAGFETTVNLIGNGVLALLRHPEQWRLLRDDPTLAASCVEEVLRFDPPVQETARIAFEDTEVGGVPVHKDQVVLTLIGGANRDPEAFASPATFDITRTPAVEHLAFSSGIHYCLGAPLARLEAATAFAVLADRLPGLRPAGPVRMRPSSTIRGPLRLPVAPAGSS